MRLSVMNEPKRLRIEMLSALDEAESDLKAGRYSDYTDETLPKLAEELKREARADRKPDIS